MRSTLLELAGAASITTGCALIATWLAFVVGGVVLIAIGYAIDRPRRS